MVKLLQHQAEKTDFSFKVTFVDVSFSLCSFVLWSVLFQIRQTGQNKSPDEQLSLCCCGFMGGILPFSWWHSFAAQMQLSFPFCLFLLSPSFRLILISCCELHTAFSCPHHFQPPLPISMRAYLLFTAPRGYLSFSPLHCECHSDTRIPQSTGPDPPPAPP